MISLLVADDHEIVRHGLRQWFALSEDIRVAAEAASGAQAIACLARGGIDLALLDLSMPGLSGAELIAQIRQAHAALPILVLSMHNEGAVVRRALAAGACGYICKAGNPESLMAAIRKLAAGGRYIDPVLAQQIVFEPARAGAALSERERALLLLLAHGKRTAEIAGYFALSSNSVHRQKARLMRKLGLANAAELTRYAVAASPPASCAG